MACAIYFFEVEKIAKLASSFMIMAFMLVNLAVMILRELPVQWYKPTYKSPLYPGLQIFGLLNGSVLLVLMGGSSLLGALFIIIVGGLVYVTYGRRHTTRTGVIGKRGRRQDLITQIPKEAGPRTLKQILTSSPGSRTLILKNVLPKCLLKWVGRSLIINPFKSCISRKYQNKPFWMQALRKAYKSKV